MPGLSQRLIEAVQQPRARFNRRDVELLIIRMRALAVEAKAVKGRGMRRGEIAIGAAAAERVEQLEAKLGGELFGVCVKRGTGAGLLIWGRFNSPDTFTLTPSVRELMPRNLGTSSSAWAMVGTRMSTCA
ncbi:hypothetical protein ACVIIV_003358 [Bradyrhizobium sp. USDA 4354]